MKNLHRLALLVAFASTLVSTGYGYDYGGSTSPTPGPGAFTVPLQIPPTLAPSSIDATTDYYDLTMQVGVKQILPGAPTTIWGYNGIFPGPTIIETRSPRRRASAQ